jgi:ABC-type oligopeptide transport system substrate-binding subunit
VRQAWVPWDRIRAEASLEGSFFELGFISDYPDPHGLLGAFGQHGDERLPDDVRRLLDHARTLRSRDLRLELYREAERKLVAEQAWIVPTIYLSHHLLHRPWVSGLWAHPLGTGPLGDVVVRKTSV